MESAYEVDICIIGAGAAGLMSAIQASQALPQRSRVLLVDGAKKVGAKILVAGGGRCNVTHHRVSVEDYNGSSPEQIKKVLRAFPVAKTKAFFAELGVELKLEDTGKLFPTTDSARTVLDSLLNEVKDSGATLWNPWRAGDVESNEDATFIIHRESSSSQDSLPACVVAKRLLLATGGKALPRTGSDGFGYQLAMKLGHSITNRIFPALVPLKTADSDQFALKQLSGLSTNASLTVVEPSGKKVAAISGSSLCTHFGLSGPAPMNISRHLLNTWHDTTDARLLVNWLDDITFEQADKELLNLGNANPLSWLRTHLPERLARALCIAAGVEPSDPAHTLTKQSRRSLAGILTECDVHATGDRGYAQAEATAGGVPLDEIDIKAMQSKLHPHLYFAGEICDVDGRIGGFNFQWAWSSGYVAGSAIARSLLQT